MIRLFDLILETTPAEQAKKLGLTHAGFGRYKDSSGKVVAMSRDGKLVKVSKKDKSKKTKKKGVDPSFQQKKADAIWNSVKNNYETIYPYPERVKELIAGEIVKGEKRHYYGDPYSSDANQKTMSAFGYLGYFRAMRSQNAGAETIQQFEDRRRTMAQRVARQGLQTERDGPEQHLEWRIRQPFMTQMKLIDVQFDWQDSSQHKDSADKKRKRNRFLNETIVPEKGKPAVVDFGNLEDPVLSRGMKISMVELDEFLSNFEIGKEVVMPPSGYSMNEGIAHRFSLQTGPPYVGVILKVRPKKDSKKMIGLHLSQLSTKDKLGDSYKDELRKAIDQARMQTMSQDDKEVMARAASRMFATATSASPYDREAEVIRPGNVKQVVTKVEKHVFGSGDNRDGYFSKAGGFGVWYVIEMEDAGIVEDSSMIQESRSALRKKKNRAKQILKKYTNSTIHFQKPSQKKTKKIR